jgi:hypothetical protein
MTHSSSLWKLGLCKPVFIILLLSFFQSKAAAPDINLFKDSLDGKLDVSDWVLSAHGFIPFPILITEPALGNIGGGLFGVFVTRNSPYVDTVDGKVRIQPLRPNLYALGGAYTANGTWAAFGGCAAVIKKWRAHYRLGTGFANVNLTFYRELPVVGEKPIEFNIQAVPFIGQLLKQLGHSSWYTGLNYLFLNTTVKGHNSEILESKEKEGMVSRAGLLVEYDQRDNIFTPDKGFRWNTLGSIADEDLGSDYNFQAINTAAYVWAPVTHTIIAGFRAEYQQVWGEPPFYMLPFINMRGIPVARYQGRIITLAETEWRWDFASRFSAVAFGGGGKAMNVWEDFSDSKFHFTGGAGARYLLARKLKLRMGLDIAHGPEDWAYYMVFGTTWLR